MSQSLTLLNTDPLAGSTSAWVSVGFANEIEEREPSSSFSEQQQNLLYSS